LSLTLTVAAANVTSITEVGSLRLADRLNTRSRLSFTLVADSTLTAALATENDEDLLTELSEVIATDEVLAVEVGAVVGLVQSVTLVTEAGEELTTEAGDVLFVENEAIFGGLIDSVSEALVIDGNRSWLRREVECVSFDALADRRLVAATYETQPQTLADIVTDVVTNYMNGDGITTINVQAGGINIDPIKFNYVTAAAVFDELASVTGWAWWIDDTRNLYFQPRAAIAAPFVIDGTNARRVSVAKAAETYRNRQLIRAGLDLTASRTENFIGNGTQKAWVLSYPVGAVPTSITVATVPQTIGIRGVDTGFDWYWNLGDSTVSQDDGAPAVGNGVAIAVTYQGQFPILVNAQDDAQVAQQAAIGGGSGIWEAIDSRSNLNDDDSALQIAQGLLRRYGQIPRRLRFETDNVGLHPGQLLTANFAPHNVSGSWLIDQVNASDRFGDALVYVVEALDGESIGGWESFFKSLSGEGRVIEFRENEVVVLLRGASEQVTLTDSITATSAAPVSTVGDAIVGYSEVGV
jgi:hypothetical protein